MEKRTKGRKFSKVLSFLSNLIPSSDENIAYWEQSDHELHHEMVNLKWTWSWKEEGQEEADELQ